MLSKMAEGAKKCKRCGATYPAELVLRAFEARRKAKVGGSILPPLRSICRPCRQGHRDSRKAQDPFLSKAQWTIRKHAKRFEIEHSKFVEVYGWRAEFLAHDAKHAFENGCPDCRRPFSTMRHGIADLTLDITNPAEAPFYGKNTRWICGTCNMKKGKLGATEWGRDAAMWSLWKANQERLVLEPKQLEASFCPDLECVKPENPLQVNPIRRSRQWPRIN